MSFVTVGSAGEAPTFFEMVAADRLMPSLKAAVTYAISVYAQRHPHLLRLLDSEDELFFLISVFLERQSLLNSSASFAESLYSLRRVPHSPSAAVGDAAGTAKGGQAALSPSQRRNSLILITLLPFLKAKVDALYVNARQQAQQAQHGGSSWAVPPAASAAATSPASAPAAPSPRDLWRKRAVAAFLKVYPWVNAAHEGSKFFYQLIYLVGKSPYFSPELHLLGLVVARVSGQDAAAAAQQRDARHTARLSRARGGPGGSLLSLLRVAWVRATTAVGEHTRSALILTVFAFKLLEWWYTSAEQKLGNQKALPPPPPPPPIPLAPSGIPLPKDPSICPLCTRPRTNPAMIAPSGHVFCYPCAFRHVEMTGQCPVTLVPAGTRHIRRLYQGT